MWRKVEMLGDQTHLRVQDFQVCVELCYAILHQQAQQVEPHHQVLGCRDRDQVPATTSPESA